MNVIKYSMKNIYYSKRFSTYIIIVLISFITAFFIDNQMTGNLKGMGGLFIFDNIDNSMTSILSLMLVLFAFLQFSSAIMYDEYTISRHSFIRFGTCDNIWRYSVLTSLLASAFFSILYIMFLYGFLTLFAMLHDILPLINIRHTFICLFQFLLRFMTVFIIQRVIDLVSKKEWISLFSIIFIVVTGLVIAEIQIVIPISYTIGMVYNNIMSCSVYWSVQVAFLLICLVVYRLLLIERGLFYESSSS